VRILLRTHTCGELNKKHAGMNVILSGWVSRIRDLGGIKFIILRDRYGETQVVVNPDSDAYSTAQEIGREFVIQVEGEVRERPEETKTNTLTGEIEVYASKINILSTAEVPPFFPGEKVSEELRLRYRYIDLRSKMMKDNIILRHKMAQAAREFLNKHGFLEIETPFLTKSTPEGARDFLVPSRLQKGKFYALPQSSKNLFIPTSVRLCLNIFSRTLKGTVAISTPIIAASKTCIGCLMLAAIISVRMLEQCLIN